MKSGNDFLVFTSAGDNANLREWIDGQPEFDLCVAYYGEQGERYKELTPYYIQNKGGKFPNLKYLNSLYPGFLQQYRSIMVMDDDIVISCQKINRLFEIQLQRDLWLLQPAFDHLGKVSHRITRYDPSCRLRYSNFVEMTCPLFRADKLLSFLDVFDPDLCGWGTDYWFMDHLGKAIKGRVAIVDEVSCINPLDETKDGGLREIDRLQSTEERRAVWSRFAEKLGIPVNGPKKQTYKKVKNPFYTRFF